MSQHAYLFADSLWGRSGQFRRPLYGSHCFAHLPATIRYLLLGREADRDRGLPPDIFGALPQSYDTVILLFLDAFGWHFFTRFAEEYGFLQRFRERGMATPITAQFPSTTANHVTCVHTCEAVGRSGVFEWYYYEPQAGAIIAPLPFSYAGDRDSNTLRHDGLTAADLFPPGTFYQDLGAYGVASYIFQHSDYTPSVYSNYVFRGADAVVPFKTFAEGLTSLTGHLRAPAHGRKRYFFLYADSLDHIGHKYGPDSEAFAAEVDATFTLLQRLFYRKVEGKVGNTLLIMTADHGQVSVNPRTTININELPSVPDLARHLRRSPRDGQPLRFGGSCRDLFLYVRDESVPEVQGRLQEALKGRAEVWHVEDLIRDGLFGPEVSDRLRKRVGNLVILPYEGESVYWHEVDRFDMHFHGHHGGLTPAEMDTGVYLLPL